VKNGVNYGDLIKFNILQEVANAVEFVILNSYINGEIIRVSGGITSLGC